MPHARRDAARAEQQHALLIALGLFRCARVDILCVRVVELALFGFEYRRHIGIAEQKQREWLQLFRTPPDVSCLPIAALPTKNEHLLCGYLQHSLRIL